MVQTTANARFVGQARTETTPRMTVIERYILRRSFVAFAGVLASTLAIVWITQALTRINLVTTSGQSVAAFLQISSLILPSIIPEVLPFAVAVAVALTFSQMNNDSELVVVTAAGASPASLARPVLLLALFASLASFVLTNFVNPDARLRFHEMIASARGDLINLILQDGTFEQIESGLYIQIGEKMANGELSGVFVADSRQEGVDLVYYAKRGSLAETDGRKLLAMRDGMIQRKAPGGDVSVIRFDVYSLDLSVFGQATERLSIDPPDQSLGFLLDPDPNDPQFRRKPGEFRAELHRRLAEWSMPIVFALIAMAVAGDARSHRESRVHPLITVVTIAVAVRLLSFFAVGATEKSADMIVMVYGVPIAAAAVALTFIALHRTMELPVGLVERVSAVFGRLVDRVGAVFGPGRGGPGRHAS